jgi:nucleotide-binding universal stress UspA family protein
MSPRLRDLRDAPAVVVGVDGSESNKAAVQYAVSEAAEADRPLVLVGAVEDLGYRALDAYSCLDADREWGVLTRIAQDAERRHPCLPVHRVVEFGNTVTCLLDHSKRAQLVVLGKRGLGTFSRIMLGSTSTSVAGRSDTPVVVVPTGWRRDEHAGRRVVVGVELGDPENRALRHAFEEAERRAAPIDVVHAIDIEPILAWDPVLDEPTYRHLESRDQRHLEDVVEPLRADYPSVPVTLCDERGNAASVLLERSQDAQLLVIGRHYSGVFGLGCTARAVLHYAEVPVAVVPS